VCDNVGMLLVLHFCDAKECVPASALHPAAGYCHSSSWPVAITVSGGKAACTAAFCSSVKAFGKATLYRTYRSPLCVCAAAQEETHHTARQDAGITVHVAAGWASPCPCPGKRAKPAWR